MVVAQGRVETVVRADQILNLPGRDSVMLYKCELLDAGSVCSATEVVGLRKKPEVWIRCISASLSKISDSGSFSIMVRIFNMRFSLLTRG